VQLDVRSLQPARWPYVVEIAGGAGRCLPSINHHYVWPGREQRQRLTSELTEYEYDVSLFTRSVFRNSIGLASSVIHSMQQFLLLGIYTPNKASSYRRLVAIPPGPLPSSTPCALQSSGAERSFSARRAKGLLQSDGGRSAAETTR